MIDVLVVAYHYPPILSGGTARAASLARHLPGLGYRPHVLTTDTFGEGGDGSVYRASEWVGTYRRLFNRSAADLPDPVRSRVRTRSALSSLARLSRRCLIPDGQIGWLPAAYRAARHILNTHPVQIILTTGPPFSSHLLGLALKQTTHLPWVADFRDTWTYDPLDEVTAQSAIRLGIDRFLERTLLRYTTRVTCVTDVAAQAIKSVCPDSRVTIIPNGYSADEIAVHDQSVEQGRFRFVHTGSFSSSHPLRRPELLVRAAETLRDELDFKLVFVGHLTDEELRSIQPLIASGHAIATGAVSRDEALAWQRKADVLVVVDHPREVLASNVPGKVYEYGASGKPILAVAPRGAMSRLVSELNAGLCVSHDIGDIADAMRAFVGGCSGVYPDPARWERFERGESASKMAEVFDGILNV